jgi:hypothetical protein
MDSAKGKLPSQLGFGGHVLRAFGQRRRRVCLWIPPAGLNSVLREAMPTVNWEECPQSVHYYHHSPERLLMPETIDDLQMILLI